MSAVTEVREQVDHHTWALLADPHASAALLALWAAPNGLSPDELARAAALTPAATQATVGRLTASGVIDTVDHQSSGRLTLCSRGLTRLVAHIAGLVDVPPATKTC